MKLKSESSQEWNAGMHNDGMEWIGKHGKKRKAKLNSEEWRLSGNEAEIEWMKLSAWINKSN